ncbi:MAG: DUF1840 domain-containing protein [Gammaproteobacteria bacterium]|nr:DUF1840 domain-containing protein [Gammaproteobacteria bacterium]
MLITFHTKAYADITMFGDVAIKLLKLMGHSGTVPSAVSAEDVPDALARLKKAIAEEAASADDSSSADQEEAESFADEKVSIQHRAFPLLQLFEAAARANAAVMWDA